MSFGVRATSDAVTLRDLATDPAGFPAVPGEPQQVDGIGDEAWATVGTVQGTERAVLTVARFGDTVVRLTNLTIGSTGPSAVSREDSDAALAAFGEALGDDAASRAARSEADATVCPAPADVPNLGSDVLSAGRAAGDAVACSYRGDAGFASVTSSIVDDPRMVLGFGEPVEVDGPDVTSAEVTDGLLSVLVGEDRIVSVSIVGDGVEVDQVVSLAERFLALQS